MIDIITTFETCSTPWVGTTGVLRDEDALDIVFSERSISLPLFDAAFDSGLLNFLRIGLTPRRSRRSPLFFVGESPCIVKCFRAFFIALVAETIHLFEMFFFGLPIRLLVGLAFGALPPGAAFFGEDVLVLPLPLIPRCLHTIWMFCFPSGVGRLAFGPIFGIGCISGQASLTGSFTLLWRQGASHA